MKISVNSFISQFFFLGRPLPAFVEIMFCFEWNCGLVEFEKKGHVAVAATNATKAKANDRVPED